MSVYPTALAHPLSGSIIQRSCFSFCACYCACPLSSEKNYLLIGQINFTGIGASWSKEIFRILPVMALQRCRAFREAVALGLLLLYPLLCGAQTTTTTTSPPQTSPPQTSPSGLRSRNISERTVTVQHFLFWRLKCCVL
jgi:hypothetical protein